MADLNCLICDFHVEPENVDDELLALMGVNSPKAAEALIRHMESHDLADWVKAFRMADAYIEKLEGQLEEALRRNVVQMPVARQGPMMPGPDTQWIPPADTAERRRQAEIRARVQAHNPDETLIRRIPDAVRPEGVVGVKY